MDSIRIDSGIKKILINDGPDILEFNPSDVLFVEKFYEIVNEFDAKLADYEKRAQELDDDKSVDANGLPMNISARIDFLHDVCGFAHARIDFVFGEGTSVRLFHGVESLDMIEQFFTGLAPFVKHAREDKLNKYRNTKGKKVLK
jgi:hypothetical protein